MPRMTFAHVSTLEEIADEGLRSAAGIYRRVFAGKPYGEVFTSDEAAARLRHILERLRLYLKDRVAAYKYLRYVWIVDESPKRLTEKIFNRAITSPERVVA